MTTSWHVAHHERRRAKTAITSRAGSPRSRREPSTCSTTSTEPRSERSDLNLMPALIDAAKSYATVGEMMSALADVFGRYVEVPSL